MFFPFHQNNSGGEFKINNDVTIIVVIEADNWREANYKAEEIGIYFDENYKIDCKCCGNRWEKLDEFSHSSDTPENRYGDKIGEDHNGSMWVKDNSQPYAIVYFKNGEKQLFYKNLPSVIVKD